MRVIAGVLVLGPLLTGCVTSGYQQTTAPAARARPEPIQAPHTLTASETKVVQEGLRSSLKDPESARFGRMLAGKLKGGDVLVCGMVNAKNSYGGYTGEKPFSGIMFQGKTFAVAMIASDRYSVQAVHEVCADQGLPI